MPTAMLAERRTANTADAANGRDHDDDQDQVPADQRIDEGEDPEEDAGKTARNAGDEPDQHGDEGGVDSACQRQLLVAGQGAHHLAVAGLVDEQVERHRQHRHQDECGDLEAGHADAGDLVVLRHDGVEIVELAAEDEARAVARREARARPRG